MLRVGEHHQQESGNTKVLTIGLGQLGYPVAAYVKRKGFDAYGYDISVEAMNRAEISYGIKKARNFRNFDVYILCVSTHNPENIFLPFTDGLVDIAYRIAEEANDGALLCIESTIPAGTSKMICDIFDHRLHVAHIPHRWYAMEQDKHGVNQLRVAGGVKPCCLARAKEFYVGISDGSPTTIEGNGECTERSLGIPLHPVNSVEIAELTKIIENAHRFLQIAFAEELYTWCSVNDVDFWELRNSLNTKWNVNILEPRDGIGGHCLPKDTRMFLGSSKFASKIIESAIQADREYKYYKKSREVQTRLDKIEAPTFHTTI